MTDGQSDDASGRDNDRKREIRTGKMYSCRVGRKFCLRAFLPLEMWEIAVGNRTKAPRGTRMCSLTPKRFSLSLSFTEVNDV